MTASPLHHIVRLRQSDDLTYVRSGLMDEVLVNANQLENSAQSTAAALWRTDLPFSVDPVLWRFQVPAWSQKGKGDTKRTYMRLGRAYAAGLGTLLGSAPITDLLDEDTQWRRLAANVVRYQQNRLRDVPTQLEFLDDLRELHPARLSAPALVAFSSEEDRINRLMVDAVTESIGEAVSVQVIVPFERVVDRQETGRMLRSLPRDGVNSYFLWTPKVTEERLLTDNQLLAAVIGTVSALAERGVPVGHQYANYTLFALHDAGLAAAVHHLGWVDHGEPAEEQGFRIRSCQTYVPGVRHCVRFDSAEKLGRHLTADEYGQWYCECTFCQGLYDMGDHPFDWLLDSRAIVMRNGQERLTPTAQAVGANTWHFLLSRRNEIEAFSRHAAAEVIRTDMERAAALNRDGDVTRLDGLAQRLRTA